MAAEAPKRRSSASSSPEFEFWMLKNPPSSAPNPPLHSADELFAGGVLLPIHLLSLSPAPAAAAASPLLSPSPQITPPPVTEPEDPPPSPPPPSSKKWKTIFKPRDRKSEKMDRKVSAAAATELNIHIWPFSRSRSSGNGRPRAVAASGGGNRRTSSAPCSRSNSRGEPAACAAGSTAVRRAGGIYLGRTSPVWQIRRRVGEVAGGRKDGGGGGGADGARMLNLHVNTCIGHRRPESFRGYDIDAAGADAAAGDRSSDGGGGGGGGSGGAGGRISGSLFNLKAIFAKKLY